jgi:hypothetical protein
MKIDRIIEGPPEVVYLWDSSELQSRMSQPGLQSK